MGSQRTAGVWNRSMSTRFHPGAQPLVVITAESGLLYLVQLFKVKKQEQQSSLFLLASFHINHYFHLAHKIVFILMFSYVCIIVLCSYLPLQSPFLSLLRQVHFISSTAPFWFFILSRFSILFSSLSL